MTDKKTPAQEAEVENATLLKILGRLLSALDASISGKERSVLVTELSTSISTAFPKRKASWPAS